jgi:antitoxin component YwqK of YwqJK toxin-antitoxin module
MSNNPVEIDPPGDMAPMRVNEEYLNFDDDLRIYCGQPFSGVGVETFGDGRLKSETPYLDGLPSGICREWYSNGSKKKEWTAIHGPVHGQYTEWYENGSLKVWGDYRYGTALSYKEWNPQGELVTEITLAADSPMHGLIKRLEQFYAGVDKA